MKTAAIVAEYNPFHSGHEYHIQKTREAGATHIVVVMSGNFVQRGEPALYDKFLRTRAALLGGADLVVELPLPWAMSGAQTFARGAVGIANALGCVDMLSFGCESSDFEMLQKIAAACSSEDVQRRIKDNLASGVTFASARQSAVAEIFGENEAKTLELPNNNLAIEYLNYLNKTGSRIMPFGVRRSGSGYNETMASGGFASAAAIRKMIAEKIDIGDYIPIDISRLYTDDFADENRLDTAILCTLRRLKKSEIALAPDISEGLENRIYSAIREAGSVDELLGMIKTKRYTLARIRRIIMSLFLGINASHSAGIPPYIRVLGCNTSGREILAAAKPTLPIVGRSSQLKSLDGRAGEIFALECAADDAYALLFSPAKQCGEDYKNRIC